MKQLTLPLLAVLLILWIIAGIFFCRRCLEGSLFAATAAQGMTRDNSAATKPGILSDDDTWSISDGTAFIHQGREHFEFTKGSFSLLNPDTKEYTETISSIANYLNSHKDRSLNIIGLYGEGEENNSIFSNLGLARANDIKHLLMKVGVDPLQLTTEGQMLTNATFREDTLSKGIEVSFGELANNDERLNTIRTGLVGKPLILYFGTDQNSLNLTAQQRQKFSDMIYYLDNVDEASINVDGHTDNTGRRAYNVELSEERANFVMKYLSENGGIPQNRMNVNGFGPDKPIESNGTTEGRSKNRRVEITLN